MATRNILETRAKLYALEAEGINYRLKLLRQEFFEGGNRAGKYMARRLQQKRNEALLMQIRGKEGVVRDEQKIIDEFVNYYQRLYEANPERPEGEIREYLEAARLPHLDEGERELDRDIWVEEVEGAIKGLKPGKAPGLTASFYKKFKGVLVKPLTRLFNLLKAGERLAETMGWAGDTLIYNEGKDPQECASYCGRLWPTIACKYERPVS